MTGSAISLRGSKTLHHAVDGAFPGDAEALNYFPAVNPIRRHGTVDVAKDDPHPALQPSPAHPSPRIDPRLVFACGIVAIVAALAIAIFIPKPEQPLLRMFAVLAGLGGASFTSGFTGLLEIDTKWLKAGERNGQFSERPWLSSLGAQPPERETSAMREEADLRESRTDVG